MEDAGTGFAFPSSSIYVETMPFGTPESVPARNEDGSQRMPSSDKGPVVEKELVNTGLVPFDARPASFA